MVEMSTACVDAIEEQNSALAAIKAEVSDMKTKTSEENLTKEIKRLIDGSAAVQGSSASPRATAQMGQGNVLCGPRNLPSYDQREKDIIHASDKLNMTSARRCIQGNIRKFEHAGVFKEI